jgi:hypothetical protein
MHLKTSIERRSFIKIKTVFTKENFFLSPRTPPRDRIPNADPRNKSINTSRNNSPRGDVESNTAPVSSDNENSSHFSFIVTQRTTQQAEAFESSTDFARDVTPPTELSSANNSEKMDHLLPASDSLTIAKSQAMTVQDPALIQLRSRMTKTATSGPTSSVL